MILFRSDEELHYIHITVTECGTLTGEMIMSCPLRQNFAMTVQQIEVETQNRSDQGFCLVDFIAIRRKSRPIRQRSGSSPLKAHMTHCTLN